MHKLILIICLVQIISCEGHVFDKVTFAKEKIMATEKFDIEKYNQCIEARERNPLLDLSQCEETLTDGTLIISSKTSDDYVVSITPPPPSLTLTYKKYYKSGILQEQSQRYLGYAIGFDVIKFGNSLYYDERGLLVKTVDESEKYKSLAVKPLDLFEILKREPLLKEINHDDQIYFKKILSLSKKEIEITAADVCEAFNTFVVLDVKSDKNHKNLFVRLSDDKKLWYVTKDLYPYGLIELELETASGKITKRNYSKEMRP